MSARDPKIDAYIASRAPFAQPILTHLRTVIHAGHPGLEEALKWGMPSFLHGGKIVCGIAGFQQHCSLWFWQGATVVGAKASEGMGNFGRLTTVADLPSASTLKAYVRKAVGLVEVRAAKPGKAKKDTKPARAAKPVTPARAGKTGKSRTSSGATNPTKLRKDAGDAKPRPAATSVRKIRSAPID